MEKSNLNMARLEKAMKKKVEHGWALPLTIDLIRHVKDAGFVPLPVLYLKLTQVAALHSSNILDSFDINLGKAINM